MGDEYAVVALGHLVLPLMQSLHKMVSDSCWSDEIRDTRPLAGLRPGWLQSYNQPSDLDPVSDHTSLSRWSSLWADSWRRNCHNTMIESFLQPVRAKQWQCNVGRDAQNTGSLQKLATLVVGCQVSWGLAGASWVWVCYHRIRSLAEERVIPVTWEGEARGSSNQLDPSRAGHNNFIQPGQQTQHPGLHQPGPIWR